MLSAPTRASICSRQIRSLLADALASRAPRSFEPSPDGLYSTQSASGSIGRRTRQWSCSGGGTARPWTSAGVSRESDRPGLPVCPICGSDRDLAVPGRRRRPRVLRRAAPSFRHAEVRRLRLRVPRSRARPSRSSRPSTPSDYHAYNENHGARGPAAGGGPGPVPGPVLRLADPAIGPGDSSTSGPATAATSTSSASTSTSSAPASRSSPRSPPRAGPEATTCSRARLETADLTGHLGRYDVVSMNHVLEHVVEPRTMLERAWSSCGPGVTSSGNSPR